MDIRQSFLELKTYCEQEDFKGWDPFDGLNSWMIQKTPLGRSRFFRLAWIQFFKRSPINFRPLVGIKKGYNPKGLGLFIIGYCNLYKVDPKNEYKELIVKLSDQVIKLRTKGYSGACWGYNFDWQARAFFQPKYAPTVVATSFITEALLEAYRVTKNKTYLDTAISATQFVLKDLNRTYDDDKDFTFSYSPLDHTQVYNAGLLGVKLLTMVYEHTNDSELLGIAKKVVNYVCKQQNPDGSWAYSSLPFHQWIDNFHTGYNLECIKFYEKISGDNTYVSNLAAGTEYYLKTFFTDSGISKYYNNKIYPVDVQAPGQLVVTLYKAGLLDQNMELVEKVLNWTIKNMQQKEGYFIYQKRRFFSSKIPYIRWSQASMFYSLSYYILHHNNG
ncbi:MAG: delta-aminolevulinic acid dehydratase [Nonlabens sp.]